MVVDGTDGSFSCLGGYGEHELTTRLLVPFERSHRLEPSALENAIGALDRYPLAWRQRTVVEGGSGGGSERRRAVKKKGRRGRGSQKLARLLLFWERLDVCFTSPPPV